MPCSTTSGTPPTRGGDDRRPGRERFDRHHRRSLVARGEHQHVEEPVVRRRRPAGSRRRARRARSRGRGRVARRLAVGAVADQAEPRVDPAGAQPGKRGEHVRQALDRGHPADPADDERVLGDAEQPAELRRRRRRRRRSAASRSIPSRITLNFSAGATPSSTRSSRTSGLTATSRVVTRARLRSTSRNPRCAPGRSSRAARGRGRCGRRSAAARRPRARAAPPDRSRLGGMRVEDVRPHSRISSHDRLHRERVETGESSRWRCSTCPTSTPSSSATNDIEPSPRASAPAPSVVCVAARLEAPSQVGDVQSRAAHVQARDQAQDADRVVSAIAGQPRSASAVRRRPSSSEIDGS